MKLTQILKNSELDFKGKMTLARLEYPSFDKFMSFLGFDYSGSTFVSIQNGVPYIISFDKNGIWQLRKTSKEQCMADFALTSYINSQRCKK
ncbi:MAG: hypothetical protein ACOCXG_03375 [Nanoarchaeota archaeon]